MSEDTATKRGRGRPRKTDGPVPPKKRHIVAGDVGAKLKRLLTIQAAHEGRTQGDIMAEALWGYLASREGKGEG